MELKNQNIKPYNEFSLKVSDIHSIHVEEAGNPKGKTVIFLHGGPGGNISEKSYAFFDLDKYHVVAFDQRGCGKSTPFADLRENTIFDLVEDIEKIREHLGLESFIVFGGSFGSTLALCYAIKYPKRVEQLVLRGIFLGRDEDIKWLYQEGASYIYPDNFDDYVEILSEEERKVIVQSYYKRLTSSDENVRLKAAKAWSHWEMGLLNLISEYDPNMEVTSHDVSLARLECHYFANNMFWDDDNYIINNIDKIKDIKTYIVHGRYDIDCRPIGAYILSKKLNNAELFITDASGHSPYEENNYIKLCEIMDNIN